MLFAEAARLRENSGPINGLSIGLGGELLPMPFRVLNCRRRVGRASVWPLDRRATDEPVDRGKHLGLRA